jgi:hypothetical protein
VLQGFFGSKITRILGQREEMAATLCATVGGSTSGAQFVGLQIAGGFPCV